MIVFERERGMVVVERERRRAEEARGEKGSGKVAYLLLPSIRCSELLYYL